MAVEEGRLTLDTPVHEVWPEIHILTGAEKDRHIRMRHLATHTSGWMTEQGPGEVWLYNNAACTAGHAAIGRIYGLSGDRVAPLVQERIAAEIGASSWDCYHYAESFASGQHGQPGPKLAIDSSLRDLTRYGYLWLRKGVWNGAQLVPRDYALEARSNQTADLDGHYGYWWFTNDRKILLPGAPEDAFCHVGNGREERRSVCLIIPSLDLVAVVGTSARAYDITSGYRSRPMTQVDLWARKVLATIRI